MLTGLILSGIGCQVLMVLSTPLTVGPLTDAYPGQKSAISKMFAGLRISVACVAFLLTPVFASLTTQLYDFQMTCDIVGLLLFVYGVIYVALTVTCPSSKKKQASL